MIDKDFLLYSNNIERISDVDPKAILRVNMAWENSKEKVLNVLDTYTNRDIFLDFPYKRTKFPLPIFNLDEAIDIANTYVNKVKYFAVSNCESYDFVLEIRNRLSDHIVLVPKIETKMGIENFIGICTAARTDIIMLDREDLTKSLHDNSNEVKDLVDVLYEKAAKIKVTIIGLQGVVFSNKNKGDNSSITKELK
jgi:pyruvate kinase